MAPVFSATRDSLTGQWPSTLPEATFVTLLAIAAVLVGLICFRIAIPHLIARMGG
jgi:hypothetical protein